MKVINRTHKVFKKFLQYSINIVYETQIDCNEISIKYE